MFRRGPAANVEDADSEHHDAPPFTRCFNLLGPLGGHVNLVLQEGVAILLRAPVVQQFGSNPDCFERFHPTDDRVRRLPFIEIRASPAI